MRNLEMKNLFAVASLMLLSGCAYSSDAIFPSLFGSEEQEARMTDYEGAILPELGSTNFEPVDVSDINNTGTFVGQKVIAFRNELKQLQTSIRTNNEQLQQIRASVINNALQYHKVTGSIEAKLQVGTTPGNPKMYEMLETAQNNVQVMSANTNSLTQLSGKAAADAASTDYLVNSIRAAYTISGAVDEDHRQLHILENEVGQTAVLMNSLLNEVNSDIARQKQYVSTANANITKLNSAIKIGSYGVNNIPLSSAPLALGTNNSVAKTSGTPLFVAKFAKSNVNYKDGLKQSVANAQAKKPNVIFDVVAVSSASGLNAVAKDYATRIFQDMVDMGVTPNRINLMSKTGSKSFPEVQIFVR